MVNFELELLKVIQERSRMTFQTNVTNSEFRPLKSLGWTVLTLEWPQRISAIIDHVTYLFHSRFVPFLGVSAGSAAYIDNFRSKGFWKFCPKIMVQLEFTHLEFELD